ncbi:hypothetical protein B0H10DRAFT_2028166 [Mycena sp. CBHHK59/15]|nr:hypothetical protein B0H10DRAFT_2028166 [Mycena sp. CBHHK59/15]
MTVPGAHSFEPAADKICEIIEAERSAASALSHQQLLKLDAEFHAFRNSVDNYKKQDEIDQLKLTALTLYRLQHTLYQASIFYSQERLAFGEPWGAVVSGLRLGSTDVPPPLLDPKGVLDALEDQKRHKQAVEVAWHSLQCNERDLRQSYETQIAQLQHQLSTLPNSQGVQSSVAAITYSNPDLHTRTKAGGNLSLKRPISANAPESPSPAKRPRSTIERIDDAALPDAYDAAPVLSPAASSEQSISEPNPIQNSPGIICSDDRISAASLGPPPIERWRYAVAASEAPNSRNGTNHAPRYSIPPLLAFRGTHACTYYIWFTIRSFLFRRLSNSQFLQDTFMLSTEEWRRILDSNHWRESSASAGKNGIYDEKRFYRGGDHCVFGMAPLDIELLRKLPLRADGTPVQPTDFDSRPLQDFICADLELAHAKLQFEQTDDILLTRDTSWSAEQRALRADARRDIFRNSWDPSFTPSLLENADVLCRRPWIISFRNLLRDWPGFSSTGIFLEEDLNALFHDALADYERRLVEFYLRTIHYTLGVYPAMPRQRPGIDQLPDFCRNIV